MSSRRQIDRVYLSAIAILSLAGFFIFLSASLGLLTQDGVSFEMVAIKQLISLAIGVGVFIAFSKIKYTFFRKTAFFILIGAIAINLLLYIPGLSMYHGGAYRWIDLGFITFQPSEFLKIAFIIYAAAWIQHSRQKIAGFKYGFMPYFVMVFVLSALLLSQSDTDTLVVIAFTSLVMFVIAGLKIRYVFLLMLMIASLVAGVIYSKPYAQERLKTYLNNGQDEQGSGYQINQSLIAIGSGQLYGRGFGQSIQKFGYLPQPTDDSIFAVAAEEFGFLGCTVIILLYVFLITAIFRIARNAEDSFGGFVAVGFGVLVVTESFVNMAAMIGLIPLSGLPLLFVSHGGTALIATLAMAGIVANISKYSH